MLVLESVIDLVAEAVFESEAEGVVVFDRVALGEAMGDPDAVREAVILSEAVFETTPLEEAKALCEAVREAVCDLEARGEDVPVRETVGVRVLVTVTMAVLVIPADFVDEALGLCVFDTVDVFVAVTVPRADLVPVTVFVLVCEGFIERVAEAERLVVRVAVAVGEIRGTPTKFLASPISYT